MPQILKYLHTEKVKMNLHYRYAKEEAVGSSETSAYFSQYTRSHMPEESTVHSCTPSP